MNRQFFGKEFRLIFAALAMVFGIAILVFKTTYAGPVLILIILGAFLLTFIRLEWGIAAAFAELFANAHGHLIDASFFGFPFSMRMAVFTGVMLGWAFLFLCRRVTFSLRDPRLQPFFPLAAAIAVGFAVGVARHAPSVVFQDGNAYLYLLYLLPILSVSWTNDLGRLLLQTFAAAAAWVSTLTIGLLYVFTHLPKWMLSSVYLFIRDTRTGELTEMHGVFRIFLQAQFSVIAFALLIAAEPWFRTQGKRALWFWLASMSMVWAVIIMSLSRSFWFGLIGGGAVLCGLLLRDARGKLETKRWVIAVGLQLAAVFGGLVLLACTILIPIPLRTTTVRSLSDLLSARTLDTGDAAISSRWNLLPEMVKTIFASPIIGSGFGQTVTFKTDDPRARALSPDGRWTTYAFEWGWADAWLKMGLLGPCALLILLGAMIKGLRPLLATERKWLGMGFISGMIMLYVTHIFSPYLNHPLGLGFILFLLPFLPKPEARAGKTLEPVLLEKTSLPDRQGLQGVGALARDSKS